MKNRVASLLSEKLSALGLKKKDFKISVIDQRRYDSGRTVFTWVAVEVNGKRYTRFDPYTGKRTTDLQNSILLDAVAKLEAEGSVSFKTDIMELQRQSALASKKVSWRHDAVVTIGKVSPQSKDSYYGFHFAPTGTAEVGTVQHLDDGSVRRFEKVIKHFENR